MSEVEKLTPEEIEAAKRARYFGVEGYGIVSADGTLDL